jgi:hypothetical protein
VDSDVDALGRVESVREHEDADDRDDDHQGANYDAEARASATTTVSHDQVLPYDQAEMTAGGAGSRSAYG